VRGLFDRTSGSVGLPERPPPAADKIPIIHTPRRPICGLASRLDRRARACIPERPSQHRQWVAGGIFRRRAGHTPRVAARCSSVARLVDRLAAISARPR